PDLNDLNEPQELKRNRVDNLEPTIEEGEVVNEPMIDIVKTRCDFIGGLDDYPSDCDFDRRIHIDYSYNLKFLCMMEPVFIGNFYVITDFTVVEDMDPYLDEGMGDVIVGEAFCKASYVEARRFDGIITIRDGDDSAEKFEVIKYSLGPNEEYIAINNCECNAWKRNEDIIMEYLVKISKKARILELRNMKITILTSYTPYPSRKIRRICAYFTKDHKRTRINTPYLEEFIRRIQVMVISILKDIERGPYSKKPSIRRIDLSDPWDQRVRSQLIGKDLVSGLLVYEMPLSSLRKKYCLSLKNDILPRDK
ncbi:hypothetical protein Tco_0828203, partial [Tanacetum coccineum]